MPGSGTLAKCGHVSPLIVDISILLFLCLGDKGVTNSGFILYDFLFIGSVIGGGGQVRTAV
ncbi:MAG: hypothetical protein M0Z37_10215, partial [Nitrospiraceae bacterium]|nr:hypothetical protein [Nitrospiraceae bacterium]